MSKVIDSEGNIKVTGLGSVISQVITDGVVDKAPSENAVFDALATKLDINALPSNLVLYPTNVASDISGYFKMVTSQDDPSYNVTAIDFVTPAITTTSQLVGSVATTAGVLSGNPGTLPNVGTIGNIKRNSGSGNATFYFEVYHRNLAGTETLIGTSNQTTSVTSSSYVEFEAFVIWNNGTFLPTDRIVIKYLANRVGSGSDPVYSFQFGGLTPTRTIVPVPASVLLNVPIQVGVTQIVDGTNGRVIYDNNGVIGEVEVDSTPTLLSANLVSSGGVATSLANKQNTLVSGTNIKTVNGNSLLGSGDLVISGGGGTPAGITGQIQFNNGGAFGADSGLFWDNTNKRLGVGATPATTVRLDVRAQGALSTDIAFRVRNSANTANLLEVAGTGLVKFRTGSERIEVNTSAADYKISLFKFDVEMVKISTYSSYIAANSVGQFFGIGNNSPSHLLDVNKSEAQNYISTRFGNDFNDLLQTDVTLKFTTRYTGGTSGGNPLAYLTVGNNGGVGVNNNCKSYFKFLLNRGNTLAERASITSQSNLLLQAPTEDTNDVGVIYIPNGTAPTANLAGGGKLYVEGGELKYRGSSGTVTVLGVA